MYNMLNCKMDPVDQKKSCVKSILTMTIPLKLLNYQMSQMVKDLNCFLSAKDKLKPLPKPPGQ